MKFNQLMNGFKINFLHWIRCHAAFVIYHTPEFVHPVWRRINENCMCIIDRLAYYQWKKLEILDFFKNLKECYQKVHLVSKENWFFPGRLWFQKPLSSYRKEIFLHLTHHMNYCITVMKPIAELDILFQKKKCLFLWFLALIRLYTQNNPHQICILAYFCQFGCTDSGVWFTLWYSSRFVCCVLLDDDDWNPKSSDN